MWPIKVEREGEGLVHLANQRPASGMVQTFGEGIQYGMRPADPQAKEICPECLKAIRNWWKSSERPSPGSDESGE
jgi:hypothetical protein